MQKDFSFINDTSFSTSQFTNASSILHRPLMINKIKQRLMPLSPTVKLGIERECCKGDFKHDLEDSIGKGSFGEVYKVTHNETGKIYAIKVLDKNQILEKNNTQLICLSGLGGDSIYSRFENIYSLSLVPSSFKKGCEYLKSQHIKGEVEPHLVIPSRVYVEDAVQETLLF